MSRRKHISLKSHTRAHNAAARSARRFVSLGKRARISGSALRGPYLPPENWYETEEDWDRDYTVINQPAGRGYRHVLTEADVRQRLAQLPEWMVAPLQVVQFSKMTRKKRSAPCYGMQWGSTIYLYPIEEALIETFVGAPKPAQRIEAQMYGARWEPADRTRWRLIWTEAAVRDFYLNNVLIHELGHILDDRNNSHRDRERWAEWFALEVGYKPSRRTELAQQAVAQYVTRRHGK